MDHLVFTVDLLATAVFVIGGALAAAFVLSVGVILFDLRLPKYSGNKNKKGG